MEASARKKKRPLAAIPENLEELSKPELIKIIQSLQQQVAKKHKGDEVDAKALQAMRKRLRDKVVKAVKKTAHNDRKKPYSEISDGCASRAVAVALMNGLHPTSDTARFLAALRMREAASECLDGAAAAATNMRVRLMTAIAMLAQLLTCSTNACV